jgi:predicted DNA-binding transcriptional regulator YafY
VWKGTQMRVDGNGVIKCQADKLWRCLTIARIWANGGGQTKGMAKRFRVTERTILRDIALLRRAGYKLRRGDIKGYWRKK